MLEGTVVVRLNVRLSPGGEKYPYTLGPGTVVIADRIERIPNFDGDWWHLVSANGNVQPDPSWIAAGRGYEVYIENITEDTPPDEPPTEPPVEPPIPEEYTTSIIEVTNLGNVSVQDIQRPE